MADDKKHLQDSVSADEKLNNAQMTPENDNPSMSDKLAAASGSITKAHAEHRARNSELVKRRIKAEKETAARIAEAEKRREQNEKAAQKVADEKIAAFDYAQNYRKKLLKEREAAVSAAKQREAEAREAAIREAREAKEETVAAFIEEERREARERSERAQALLDSVTKREIIDENGNKVLVDRFPKPAEEAPMAEEEKPATEEVAAEEVPEAETPAEEAPTADDAVEEPVAEDKAEEPAEQPTEDVAEAAAEEPAEEVADEPSEEVAEESQADEAVPEETAEVAETPVAEEATETPETETSEEKAPAEESEENVNDAADENADENTEEPNDVDSDDAADVEDGEESEPEADEAGDNVVTIDYEVKEVAEDNDDTFEMTFDEDGKLVIKRASDSAEEEAPVAEEDDEEPASEAEPEAEEPHGPYRDIPEVTDEDVYAFNERYKRAVERKRADRARAKGIDPDAEKPTSADDVLLHDEIVSVIKAEGARLVDEESVIKLYLRHSDDAVKSFERALRQAQKSLDNNRNESETPTLLISILKICSKILEIRCNNLENFARIKAYKYIRNSRIILRREVDRYNDYVISYSAITGEQLTRLSTLLPESIAAGKSLAVVPSFTYKESYVQAVTDENGEITGEDASSCIKIEPPCTALELMGDTELPRSKFGCIKYRRRVNRAMKILSEDYDRLGDLILKTKQSKKRYENELRELDAHTPLAQRAEPKYKNKVFRISIKYGKKLSGIDTTKTRSAFARTRQRLFVTRLAVEREKLQLAYTYLREVYRVGKFSQKKLAEEMFIGAMVSYNKCAEGCTKLTGTQFDTLPTSLIERICRGEEMTFPTVAYKRELIETVGENSRVISTALRSDVAPDEIGYAEHSERLLSGVPGFRNADSLDDESPMTDRASAVSKIMLLALREAADAVNTVDELEQLVRRSERAIKYFKKSLKATERAMSRAFDDDGVIIALVENLRVISNLIEARRIVIEASMRLRRTDHARAYSRALYKEIELYNGRAIDYMSIVGEQFSRITTATPKDLMNSASSIKVPSITYKDNYIEVFPRDPLKEMSYEKPYQRNRKERTGYTPLLMKHYRLTENRAVEMSLINSPFVFDVTVNEDPIVSWWHPIGFFQHLFVWAQPIVAWFKRMATNAEIWFIDESALVSKSGVEKRQRKNDKRRKRFEAKLNKLSREHKAKLLSLETVVHDSDRHSASYQKKLYKLNTKYNRRIYRLKMRWMQECTGRNKTRLLLEKLVLERERLTGINKVLIKYRSYGRVTFLPNVLVRYKRKFLEAISAHNKTAAELSELLGVPFSEVSTSVAEEIIRYGNTIKFPQIICCREIIETIDDVKRTVGDKWHGYGLYTGTSGSDSGNGNAPVMSVGAMGYATDMGVPFLKADFGGMTMLGMTPGGVPLIGFGNSGEAAVPFTGTPMMLQGTDDSAVLDAGIIGRNGPILGATDATNPYSGIHSAGVDAIFVDNYESDAMDLKSGSTTETPLDLESKMIEERFSRALKARSMTTVDGVATWWKLIGSEINVWFMRKLFLRRHGFLRFLVPKKDDFTEIVNTKLSSQDVFELENIAKVGTIIDIECQRLYSATKAGIRRSQRVWSRWLHDDIEYYNSLVSEFNMCSSKARKTRKHDVIKPRLRNEWIEPLSLSIPDRIIHRLDDRPPTPPVLSLRNKVEIDEHSHPVTAGGLYDALYDYAKSGAFKHAGFLAILIYGIPYLLMRLFHVLRFRGAVMGIASMLISARAARTHTRRFDNEARYYRIRYEKARAMKRFNKRALKATGVANVPIKYQSKSHESLRKYVAANFRIDYNMRIRQLIYRSLRMDFVLYWAVTIAFCTVIALTAILGVKPPVMQAMIFMGIIWALTPIICILLRVVYDIVMLIASVLLLLTRNIWLIKYGTRDVERNRYGIVLDCFVSEQFKLLSAAEKLKRSPRSKPKRRKLISIINKYNRQVDKFSKVLRIPITEVEPTSLIEKLVSGDDGRELTELQNFIYVRELVEKVNEHDIGDTARKRELDAMLASLQGELNAIINEINAQNPVASSDVTFLQSAVQRLINFIQTGATPTENERFELKRDLIGAINRFELTDNKIELFSKDVIKIVDSLGKKPKRRIISVLAVDDMIDLKTKNKIK